MFVAHNVPVWFENRVQATFQDCNSAFDSVRFTFSCAAPYMQDPENSFLCLRVLRSFLACGPRSVMATCACGEQVPRHAEMLAILALGFGFFLSFKIHGSGFCTGPNQKDFGVIVRKVACLEVAWPEVKKALAVLKVSQTLNPKALSELRGQTLKKAPNHKDSFFPKLGLIRTPECWKPEDPEQTGNQTHLAPNSGCSVKPETLEVLYPKLKKCDIPCFDTPRLPCWSRRSPDPPNPKPKRLMH